MVGAEWTLLLFKRGRFFNVLDPNWANFQQKISPSTKCAISLYSRFSTTKINKVWGNFFFLNCTKFESFLLHKNHFCLLLSIHIKSPIDVLYNSYIDIWNETICTKIEYNKNVLLIFRWLYYLQCGYWDPLCIIEAARLLEAVGR